MSMTMVDYIHDIPTYIKNQMSFSESEWKRLAMKFYDGTYSSFSIIASGSSYNAANCAKYHLKEKLGVPVYLFTPFTFINYESVDKHSFYLVISQSGRSVNSLSAVNMLNEHNITAMFLTDNEEIFSTDGQCVFQLGIGGEQIPFVTKGFSATVFFLLSFADYAYSLRTEETFCVWDTDSFANSFQKQIDNAVLFFENNKKSLLTMKRVHICGAGPGQSIAVEAALKFGETLQIAATGYEIEEFLHGGNFELQKEHVVFLIQSSDCMRDRVSQLKKYLPFLCDTVFVLDQTAKHVAEGPAAILYGGFFQMLVYLINKELGDPIPIMKDRYLSFESMMKAKTQNYYE